MRGGGGCFEFAILAGGEGEGVAVVVIAVVRMVVFGGCGCGGGGWWGRSGGVGWLLYSYTVSSYDISLSYPTYSPNSLEGSADNTIHGLFLPRVIQRQAEAKDPIWPKQS